MAPFREWCPAGKDRSCSICTKELTDACAACRDLLLSDGGHVDCGVVMGACQHAFHAHCMEGWEACQDAEPHQCPQCDDVWAVHHAASNAERQLAAALDLIDKLQQEVTVTHRAKRAAEDTLEASEQYRSQKWCLETLVAAQEAVRTHIRTLTACRAKDGARAVGANDEKGDEEEEAETLEDHVQRRDTALLELQEWLNDVKPMVTLVETTIATTFSLQSCDDVESMVAAHHDVEATLAELDDAIKEQDDFLGQQGVLMAQLQGVERQLSRLQSGSPPGQEVAGISQKLPQQLQGDAKHLREDLNCLNAEIAVKVDHTSHAQTQLHKQAAALQQSFPELAMHLPYRGIVEQIPREPPTSSVFPLRTTRNATIYGCFVNGEKLMVKRIECEGTTSNPAGIITFEANRRRILQEVDVMKRVRSSSLLQCVASFETSVAPGVGAVTTTHPPSPPPPHYIYVVTPYHRKGDLSSYMYPLPSPEAQVQLPSELVGPDAVRRMFSQLLEGLNELHSHRIIHGDLKPHNVLVRDDFGLVICDFGSAHFYDCGETVPDSGSKVIEQRYAAPEILSLGGDDAQRQQPFQRTAANDVFSLGLLLAELSMHFSGVDRTSSPVATGVDADGTINPTTGTTSTTSSTTCTLTADASLDGTSAEELDQWLRAGPDGRQGFSGFTPLSLSSQCHQQQHGAATVCSGDRLLIDLLHGALMRDPTLRLSIEDVACHPYLLGASAAKDEHDFSHAVIPLLNTTAHRLEIDRQQQQHLMNTIPLSLTGNIDDPTTHTTLPQSADPTHHHSHLLDQCCESLLDVPLTQRIKVQFLGESGIDANGLTKELYSIIFNELLRVGVLAAAEGAQAYQVRPDGRKEEGGGGAHGGGGGGVVPSQYFELLGAVLMRCALCRVQKPFFQSPCLISRTTFNFLLLPADDDGNNNNEVSSKNTTNPLSGGSGAARSTLRTNRFDLAEVDPATAQHHALGLRNPSYFRAAGVSFEDGTPVTAANAEQFVECERDRLIVQQRLQHLRLVRKGFQRDRTILEAVRQRFHGSGSALQAALCVSYLSSNEVAANLLFAGDATGDADGVRKWLPDVVRAMDQPSLRMFLKFVTGSYSLVPIKVAIHSLPFSPAHLPTAATTTAINTSESRRGGDSDDDGSSGEDGDSVDGTSLDHPTRRRNPLTSTPHGEGDEERIAAEDIGAALPLPPMPLPRSHTCSNQLDVYEYPSQAVLEEKLRRACHECRMED